MLEESKEHIHANQEHLRIINLLIKEDVEDAEFGRFRKRYKIINLYLTEFGKSDVTWLQKLFKDLSETHSIVAAAPAIRSGEFDMKEVCGVVRLNKTRLEMLKRNIEHVAPKVDKSKESMMLNEKSFLNTVHYQFIDKNTCCCGCGVPAGFHKCTVCKDSFFPLCLLKEDNEKDGICKICDLCDHDENSNRDSSVVSPTERDEEEEEEFDSSSTESEVENCNITSKRFRKISSSDDEEEDDD